MTACQALLSPFDCRQVSRFPHGSDVFDEQLGDRIKCSIS